jgi:hypothetical protein
MMSLFALPVSVSDLTKLQLGIEFFTNPGEATTEAGQITNPPATPTVYSYAVDLLANNISLSQVAMAVDSLMFGVTDKVTELTKLATQFLPAQVANAVAHNLNPTVYAAEALGLALAGGNGTSNAFATHFGSLSVSDFASAVASLTGINSGAIQQFVNNWINFYTANPPAGGLAVTLASYGAAFGDAVGAALLNPTVNGSLALLVSETQNALIDNAEGSYKAGIALIAEPAHLPLQGEALLIPGAGGPPFGRTIDWAALPGTPGPYAQFITPAQVDSLEIDNTPSTFTLDTQHFGAKGLLNAAIINAADLNGSLFTLIVGDSAASENLGRVVASGYSTVNIVANGPAGSAADILFGILSSGPSEQTPQSPSAIMEAAAAARYSDLVISGSHGLVLGDIAPAAGTEGAISIVAATITDHGVALVLGATNALKIDASDAPVLIMFAPASFFPNDAATGVTVLGGTGPNELQGSLLQGSLGEVSKVTFTNGSTGWAATGFVGADHITGGSAGGDLIFGDGSADVITLPNHSLPDTVVFGQDTMGNTNDVLAITDGNDVAFLGSWGAGATTATIPTLFPGSSSGGTSADMTVITGLRAGSAGDVLEFELAAWNGDSFGVFPIAASKGDLVALNGLFVPKPGAAQLSAVWVDSGSNNSLKAADNVLLYAPSDASVQNAQQLAAQLHSSSDAIVLPGAASGLGFIPPGQHAHILVAYDASFSLLGSVHPVVNIADVDLVNTSASNQTSTANLNVYASDMVSLTGVSLTGLTSANIHYLS